MKWEDPPPDARGNRRKWQKEADELRSNPGRWALITECGDSSLATRISHGHLMAFRPAGTFETRQQVIHRDERGIKSKIWARYIGEGDGTAQASEDQ